MVSAKTVALEGVVNVRFVIAHFKEKPLAEIGQTEIDAAAAELFPDHTNATHNREVYSPVSAIMKHAGVDFRIRRPKGSRGRELTGARGSRAAAYCRRQDRCRVRPAVHVLALYGPAFIRGNVAPHLRPAAPSRVLCLHTAYQKRPAPSGVSTAACGRALANHPRGLERGSERVFRHRPSGRIYKLLYLAADAAGVNLPDREAFHIFRHTYGSWMRRYAGSDTKGLIATGAWKSEQSASRYAHTVVSEESQKSAMLPKIKLG
jgi:hypothetical protein